MRLITDTMGEYRKGKLVDQATRLFNEVCRAVQETGKAGAVTITIKVKPGKEDGEYSLQANVTSKRPEPDLPDAIYFMNDAGDLMRTDPRQGTMPFVRDVDDDRTKSANAG